MSESLPNGKSMLMSLSSNGPAESSTSEAVSPASLGSPATKRVDASVLTTEGAVVAEGEVVMSW
jgi:hypothetical protein